MNKNKELILTHKEFAGTIIERLQNKIKECEEKVKQSQNRYKKAATLGKMMWLNEVIEEMEEFMRQLETWYE